MAKSSVFDKGALMFVGAICGVALLAIIVQAALPGNACNEEVKIAISNNQPTENTALTLTCGNLDATSWDWDFGDGTAHSMAPIANHVYKASKKYTITLKINKRCIGTLKINVGKDIGSLPLPVIEGPASTVIGAPVKFKETSGKGTTWEWKFQESVGVVDATEQQPTYTFKTAGRKIIEVTMNGAGKSQVGYFDIDVKDPAAKGGSDGSGGGGGAAAGKGLINEVQFIALVNDVSARKKDATAFTKYFCGQLNTVITVNGKQTPFDAFCAQTSSANYEIAVDNLTLTKDPQNKCIIGAVLNYHKGKWLPWRKK